MTLNEWAEVLAKIEHRLAVIHTNYLSPNHHRVIIAQSNYQRCRLADKAYCWKKHLHNATRTVIFVECVREAMARTDFSNHGKHEMVDGLLEERGFY